VRWLCKLSQLDDTPEVITAVERITAVKRAKVTALVYESHAV
jgi:hypothetical protein